MFVARRHVRVLDGLLGAVFCAADGALRSRADGASGRVCLVAVGGYGRGLVGLCSDVDVVFLCDSTAAEAAAILAESVLYPLWDLGLEIGHAVRTLSETLELASTDLKTATTLLDMRRVTGDTTLLPELERLARPQIFGAGASLDRFLTELESDRLARYDRFGGSLYLLEPEVKMGCGGLRDLDVARWAGCARWGARTLEDLVRQGVMLSREVRELRDAQEHLWRVRNLLHARAGRRQDRLTFEDQEEIAKALGFKDGLSLGVEQFMQRYYQQARRVEQTAERIVARALVGRRSPAPVRTEVIGPGLILVGDAVSLRDTGELEQRPALALQLYEQVALREAPPYSYARDAIARRSANPGWAERLRASPTAPRLFLNLLISGARVPVKRGSVLSELHEVGLLLAMIPEFEPVTGRVQHDVYHVYTVDVHSVAAVDRLRSIKRGDYATRLPLASRLAAEMPRPATLFLALLLHDLGKAYGRDHARRGAAIAKAVASRLGLRPMDVEDVEWLVQEHLNLYHWATRRDTNDPAVVAEVARQVGSLDRLRNLYLLTVCDLSTTNPNAMTSWKARMLEDLYFALVEALEGGVVAVQHRVAAIRSDVQVGFTGDAGQAALEAFLRDMPDRYVLSNPVDAIRNHARAARDRGERSLHVAAYPGPSPETSELVFATDDRPGLLADIAAVLAAHGLAVTSAQVYTRAREGGRPEAFDVFHVRRTAIGAEGEPVDEPKLKRILGGLTRIQAGETSAEELLSKRLSQPSWARRHSPDVPTEILVDNEASPDFTVVDVFTRDRPALLHTIARFLYRQGLSIGVSKVNTEGEKVADVFYVREAGGGKLEDPASVRVLRDRLRDELSALDREGRR